MEMYVLVRELGDFCLFQDQQPRKLFFFYNWAKWKVTPYCSSPHPFHPSIQPLPSSKPQPSPRKPSHPQLSAFISHMANGDRGHWESTLGSVPRLPNHSACEMGELTQTGGSSAAPPWALQGVALPIGRRTLFPRHTIT